MSDQPFFKAYPENPGVKAPYRETSVAAGKSVIIKQGSLKARCLSVIAKSGGQAADEIADELGQSVLNVRPAVSALVNLGMLVDSGDRRENDGGNSQIVWRIRTAADTQASFVANAVRPRFKAEDWE